jgi:hypothetical protein
LQHRPQEAPFRFKAAGRRRIKHCIATEESVNEMIGKAVPGLGHRSPPSMALFSNFKFWPTAKPGPDLSAEGMRTALALTRLESFLL